MRYSAAIWIWVVFFAAACGGKKKVPADAVARFGNEYLLPSEMEGFSVPLKTMADSAAMISYINSWLMEKLLVEKARLNLPEEEQDFEKLIEQYRNSLLIHAYQEQLVSQMLDTNITEEEIRKYYDDNPDDFALKNNIVRAEYVIFARKNPSADKVRGWFTSTDQAKREKLNEFCNQSAFRCSLWDSTWVMMDALEKIIPLEYASQELFLSSRKFVEIQDSSLVYLLKINDYKIKESLSPLEFEKERIRNIILNVRKTSLLMDMQQNTYKDAFSSGKLEIYFGK